MGNDLHIRLISSSFYEIETWDRNILCNNHSNWIYSYVIVLKTLIKSNLGTEASPSIFPPFLSSCALPCGRCLSSPAQKIQKKVTSVTWTTPSCAREKYFIPCHWPIIPWHVLPSRALTYSESGPVCMHKSCFRRRWGKYGRLFWRRPWKFVSRHFAADPKLETAKVRVSAFSVKGKVGLSVCCLGEGRSEVTVVWVHASLCKGRSVFVRTGGSLAKSLTWTYLRGSRWSRETANLTITWFLSSTVLISLDVGPSAVIFTVNYPAYVGARALNLFSH